MIDPDTSDETCGTGCSALGDKTPDCLGYLLTVLGHRLKSDAEATCSQLGLNPRDFLGLERLSRLGLISQTELGRALCLDRTSTMQLTDRLEQQGWITRQPDADDRRVNRLDMTESGRALLTEARSRMQAMEDHFCRSLSPDERETLRALLSRLY